MFVHICVNFALLPAEVNHWSTYWNQFLLQGWTGGSKKSPRYTAEWRKHSGWTLCLGTYARHVINLVWLAFQLMWTSHSVNKHLFMLFLFSVGVVKIVPCENSRTFVNGKLVTESTVLRSGLCWFGASVQLSGNCYSVDLSGHTNRCFLLMSKLKRQHFFLFL